jgi:hypothetical protein
MINERIIVKNVVVLRFVDMENERVIVENVMGLLFVFIND